MKKEVIRFIQFYNPILWSYLAGLYVLDEWWLGLLFMLIATYCQIRFESVLNQGMGK